MHDAPIYRFYRRRFLNRPGMHTGAYVLAAVEDTRVLADDDARYADHTLRISDCDRVISLDLDLGSPAHRRNTLAKIDTLIATLVKLRAALGEEARVAANRERTRTLRDRRDR
ncbi:hypothetical protein ER308_08685 [Egibacter rhizosphaerae]|uniref:Uncharacterized protein n=1 Tax=Egibacter rhizosphaerae TaxID=1670831 RepID=A0A411YEI5_9ACTN|nr:hypothetical protein [Egibacter rhizosphaerae]QBI19618.1 hypothetical protein ER308_08685 [Egibacter rhizosphaerae]